MKSGEGRSTGGLALPLWLGLLPVLAAGCAASPPPLDRALMAERGAETRNQEVAGQYFVGCPDILELTATNRPDLSGLRAVGADGRIDLGRSGGVRVEGLTLSEITAQVAGRAGLPPAQVNVRVAEYRSQQVYLFGQVQGLQRAVPYQGQETVLDLLQRVGGITSGAAANDVHVVRSRVADGQTPEVYPIDLQAILVNRDHRTNIRLQPFDQIHIGETRQSYLQKCLPPCVRPIHQAICRLGRGQDKATR